MSKELKGTVKPYGKHLVICCGNTNADCTKWESKIEKEEGSYAQILTLEIKQSMESIGYKVMVTLSEDNSIQNQNNVEMFDIIAFPDMIRFVGVKRDQIHLLVKEFLVEKKKEFTIPNQPLESKIYVLICAHKKRDKRCGVFGPILAEEFEKELKERGIDKVSVSKTSHYGGHKFAGNVIVYPSGNWFGRVTPCDVGPIIDLHITNGKIIDRLWRGTIDKDKTEW